MSRLLIKKNIELYGSDSASIDKLNDVAYYLRNSAHDTSLVYAYKALELSKKTNYIRGMAKSLFTISICNIYQANFSLALESAFQAYKYYEQIQDKEYMAFILNNIGYLYKEQKNYSAAFSYLERVKNKVSESLGFGSLRHSCLRVFIRFWRGTDKLREALKSVLPLK